MVEDYSEFLICKGSLSLTRAGQEREKEKEKEKEKEEVVGFPIDKSSFSLSLSFPACKQINAALLRVPPG
jgi:hypothetical protein